MVCGGGIIFGYDEQVMAQILRVALQASRREKTTLLPGRALQQNSHVLVLWSVI